MRRQEINYEKVAKAAEKIKKRGIERPLMKFVTNLV